MSTQRPPRSVRLLSRLRSSRLLPLLLRVDLRRLILGMSLLAVLVTFLNTFHAGYSQQRELLIRNTLDANQAYASKMAELTDVFLQQALSQLSFSAHVLGSNFDDVSLQTAETRRLVHQNKTFNSVLIVNADGKIVNITPPLTEVLGLQISSAGMLSAYQAREPRVSEPFVTSGTARLVIFISYPVYSQRGDFLGFIGGTVYLHEDNGLHSVLGRHHYQNGSYLFVVDRQGNLVFHANQQRVGENVMRNPVVQAVRRGETGSAQSENTRGTAMLSGYAPVSSTGWGVVVQRPTDLTLELLTQPVMDMLLKVAPLLMLTLLAIWFLTRLIANPLHDLAMIASRLDDADTERKIGKVPSWYYEVIKLKHAILAGLSLVQRKISRLNHENVTDPLTGLLNRRGMDDTLRALDEARLPFSVVVLDIDRFKAINDTHGHDVGDAVLRFLAERMRRTARSGDVLCRNGGDEFTMLLPGTPSSEAVHACERLAQALAIEEAYEGVPISLSMGVADFRLEDRHVEDALKAADVALYRAKQGGRNQIAVAERT